MNMQAVDISESLKTVRLQMFVKGYIECALWSTNDDDGEPLDGAFDESDLTDETLVSINEDCETFVKDNEADLTLYLEQFDASQAGHDFWLTRNRHGAGFWSRDLDEDLGERLSGSARAFGEVCLYVYRKKVFAS